MPVAKLLLAGMSASGKTETIRAVSHFPAQVVRKRVPATQATLSLDYGRVFVAPYMVYLYSSSRRGKMVGQDWAGLMEEMDCIVYVVNGTSSSAVLDLQYYAELETTHQLPTIVAINGTAMPGYNASLLEEFTSGLPAGARIVLYDAVDQDSSRRVVAAAAEQVLRGA